MIVHAGFALNILDEEEATRTLEYLRQMEELGEWRRTRRSRRGEALGRIPRRGRRARAGAPRGGGDHASVDASWRCAAARRTAIVRFGVDELLPEQITLVHGPGCPVCVTPLEIIDKAWRSPAAPA